MDFLGMLGYISLIATQCCYVSDNRLRKFIKEIEVFKIKTGILSFPQRNPAD